MSCVKPSRRRRSLCRDRDRDAAGGATSAKSTFQGRASAARCDATALRSKLRPSEAVRSTAAAIPVR